MNERDEGRELSRDPSEEIEALGAIEQPLVFDVPRRPLNLDALTGALALIWAGGVLLAANLGYLDWFAFDAFDLGWNLAFEPATWTLIFLGLGVLVTISMLIRLLLPAYRRNLLGYTVLGIIFFSLALGLREIVWPLILIVVGLALLMAHHET